MPDPEIPRIVVSVRYERGHAYEEGWVPAGVFCLHCGRNTVWCDDGSGDYYVGNNHLCLSCGGSFTCQPGSAPSASWQDEQRLEAIRTALLPSPP